MAIISRSQLDYPALGTPGGAALHQDVEDILTKLGNDASSRYFEEENLLNANSVDFEHNFKVAYEELTLLLYTRTGGALGELTRVPDSAAFSIDPVAGNETTRVRVTNGTGVTQDISLVVIHDGGSSSGSGTGEINYIDNPDAEAGLSGWTAGGSSAIVQTATTGELLRGTRSFKLTTGAVSNQIYYDFVLPEADENKLLKIEFDLKALGSYIAGDLFVKIIKDPSGSPKVLTPNVSDIPAGQGLFQSNWASEEAGDYRLVFETAVASGESISIDNVIVGPGKTATGAVVNVVDEYAWTDKTTIGASGGGLSFGAGSQSHITWYRIGDRARGIFNFEQVVGGSAGSGLYELFIPTTVGTVDTSRIPDTGTYTNIGMIRVHDGTFENKYSAYIETSGSIRFRDMAAGTTATWAASSSTNFGDTFLGVSGWVDFPVAEWKNSGVVSLLQENNLDEWAEYTPTFSQLDFTTNVRRKRVGSSMIITGFVEITGLTGQSANPLEVSLPAVGTLNTNIIPTGQDYKGAFGSGGLDDAGVPTSVLPYFIDTSNYGFYKTSAAGTTPIRGTDLAIGDILTWNITVPIAEWANLNQNSVVGFSEATGVNLGLVKKNRWSQKTGGSSSGSGTNTVHSFSNLVTGRVYKMEWGGNVSRGTPDTIAGLAAYENGSEVSRTGLEGRGAIAGEPLESVFVSGTYVFEATGTTASVRYIGTNANNFCDAVWATLIELNNYEAESTTFD
jgi:hypothetical protein